MWCWYAAHVQLLTECLLDPSLRDEVFLQVAKQLRDNPSMPSMERGWVLMRLCCESFPPSEEAENFIEHFLRARGARSCVHALHLSLFRGPAVAPPSISAIVAAFASASSPPDAGVPAPPEMGSFGPHLPLADPTPMPSQPIGVVKGMRVVRPPGPPPSEARR
jgi:hypothetical protein